MVNNRLATLSALIIVSLLSVLVFLFLVNFFNISYPISVTTKTASELSVVGEGQVDVVPDTGNVSVGITSQGSNVDQVQKDMNQKNNAIVSALTNIGVSKKDISTSNYSINPTYDYERGQTITGYNGSATLTVKSKDVNKLPGIITAATGAGANQIYGTSYSIDDPQKFREEARNEAIANAKEQAEKLANQLGIRLGKITNIVESGGDTSYPPIALKRETAAFGGDNMPSPDLQPGTQTITSTVTLFFEKR